MKKITLLLMMLLTVTFGFSQQVLQDFEAGGLGDAFGNGASAALVPDPETGGTRGQVAELTSVSTGDFFQGVNINFFAGVRVELTTDKSMQMDVYSLTPIAIAPKVISGVDGAPDSTTSASHTGSGWETLTFTFNDGFDGTTTANGIYGAFVIYYNWDTSIDNFGTTNDRVFYVDNITGIENVDTCGNGVQDGDETGVDCGGSCGPCPNPPAGPPTTPPNRNASDVVSVYSNAYTQAPTDGFQIFGGAVVDEIDFSGNTVRSVTTPDNGSGLQYQYFNTTPAFLDLSAMSNMHIDFYFEGSPTAVGTVFIVIAQYSDGTNIQKNFDVTSLDPNVWHEMDVAFADFDGNPANARDEIQQVIVQVAGADGSVVGPFYFDNLYFHNTTLNNDSFSKAEFRAYPNPTQDVWNIRTTESIKKVEVYNITGRLVKEVSVNASEAVINANELSSGVYLAKISNEFDQTRTIKLIKE